ncbi:MAG: type 2 lanthipeptide synthetase LanM family protein [Nostoc sp.]|uniref:type 2 lanthipeptide synthetase LanM family protein n=1 Tax=Nostoc sp. TaxID=1180 RepID=UPI002FF8BDEE
MNQLELIQIVAQSSSLSERLNNNLFKIEDTQTNQQQIEVNLERWCQVVAQGNWEKFQKRLEWDELDINIVSPLLGTMTLVDSNCLPHWAETLKEIIETAATINQDKLLFASEHPLPFEDVLLPLIWVARQQLRRNISFLSSELLSDQASFNLEYSLLKRLVTLCEKTLEFEFSNFRPFNHTLLLKLGANTNNSPTKELYHRFVSKLLEDGLLAFFQKYSVLAKLVTIAIDFWVETNAEFLQRLQTDLSELKQTFGRLGRVIEIHSSLSDPHNRGRSVIILIFETQKKLVYKPKNVSSEVIYNQFLDWCNQRDIALTFKILKIIDCKTYGWVEYVEYQPCENILAAQRFYERLGMLLATMYALGGTDCIYQNLIANGEHPVLIDMEALMYHEVSLLADTETGEHQDSANQKFWDSVIRSGLLPRWHFNQDNSIAFDVSALGNVEPQQAPWSMPQWKFINTDDMHLAWESTTIPPDKNVPNLNGIALSPDDYLDNLIAGFRQMYYFLLEQKTAILQNDSPLTALKGKWVRFTFRQTRIYTIIFQKLLVPRFMRSGVERSIELDVLSRAFLRARQKPIFWTVLQAEIAAMEQLDIPYFGGTTDSDALSYGVKQPIPKYFKQSSYNQVIARLERLDQIDLAEQVIIIEGAFAARVARISKQGKLDNSHLSAVTVTDLSQVNSLTYQELILKTENIAKTIEQMALSTANNSCYWLDLAYISDAARFQLQPLNYGLYDGNCGIALFLAALDSLKNANQFHSLTLKSLESLRAIIQKPNNEATQRFARNIGIGGAKGLGSIVYCLVKISQFIKDTTLLEDAERTANLIKPELIQSDREFHLMGGSAGTILGLITLYQVTKSSKVLEKAIICGQHLLKNRISLNKAYQTWKTLGDRPLTGLSCGAAGIAYALLRLYEITKDREYLEAAKEGIAYESSVFSEPDANWPDFRFCNQQNGHLKFNISWCHGASGIGLARLGGLSILKTEQIEQDIEIALQTTQNYCLQKLDSLCYGNFGRIETLLVASQKLSSPQLQAMALKQAALAVTKAEEIGAYRMLHNLSSHKFSLSFFQGIAGIGYELLRLASPEKLPSVLLWE